MNLSNEEKTLLLGALFHDIGKFEQRVLSKKISHSELGAQFVDELKDEFLKVLRNENDVESVKKIIRSHHIKNPDNALIEITKKADHLSASERVNFDKEDDWQEKWSHKFMTSLFSKIYLNQNDKSARKTKYYAHRLLTKKNYKILIPQYETEKDIKESSANYPTNTFDDFTKDIKAVFSIYEDENDFPTLINLLLIVFEKYLWCIPDFTGSENTDISFYNHLKDVAGIAHAIYKSDNEGTKLNLIIGDLPGIQKYIFNVANRKPAKILRGRSIFVQILTRQIASRILNKLGLTDANLIMLAGGKFYIIAQNSEEFNSNFSQIRKEIDDLLIKNFNFQISFSTVAYSFDYIKLMNKEITFGDIIDEASYQLLLKRNQQFENYFFNKGNLDEAKFIISEKYIEPKIENDTNSVKCAVTDFPIRKAREKTIENELTVDKQVWNEYRIGSDVTKSNLIIEFDASLSNVEDVKPLKKYKVNNNPKIILNPVLDDLLKYKDRKILKNALIMEVANYTTKAVDAENVVMDFEDMEKSNNGAQIMSLIKGDIDNLGLIMSSGLAGNKDFDNENLENEKDEPFDLTGISRTTTLSNHLKYFFSFSLNGFLEDWENGKILDESEKEKFNDRFLSTEDGKKEFEEYIKDRKVYTVFAGGDDLMIICPQSSSLKLVEALNSTFNDFICENPEVHISYSITNFKHSTPIRIVADMAEENQDRVKSKFKASDLKNEKSGTLKSFEKRISEEPDIFYEKNDKAAIRLFNTNVKNSLINKMLSFREMLINWVNDEENKVTRGVLRNLLYFSKIMKDFNEKNDTRLLMWHPKMTYMINRLLKDKNGNYVNPEVAEFFDTALKINNGQDIQAIILEQILYPVVCEAIYGTRNYKGV